MGEFTVRVQRVLAIANTEAARLEHEYIGTEHILLGLILERQNVAITVLENLGVTVEGLRLRIESSIMRGRPSTGAIHDRPYTSRARSALDLARVASIARGNSYIGAEHVLLGLLDEGQNIAAAALEAEGVTSERVREETIRLLGRERSRP